MTSRMIVVDTCVLSELTKVEGPDPRIGKWYHEHAEQGKLLLCAPVLAEWKAGAHGLKNDESRQKAIKIIVETVAQDFAGEVIPFCYLAADRYADLRQYRGAVGREMKKYDIDMQIASIAYVKDHASIATLDNGISPCGVEVINLWELKEGEK